MSVANDFPSLKAKRLLSILQRKPLSYRVIRQSGSHRRLESQHHPPITVAFHDKQTIRPAVVRRILCEQIGLEETEARDLL